MREITINWTVANGGGGTTVLYFDSAPAVAAQRLALRDWLTSYASVIPEGSAWNIASSGREMSESNGDVTGFWSDPVVQGGNGSSATTAVPNVAQVLVQWYTETIRRNRRVRGRTFLPGLSMSTNTNGNVTQSTQALIIAGAQALVDAAVGLSVWSRPSAAGPGALSPVTAAGCWAEFAMLGQRRT